MEIQEFNLQKYLDFVRTNPLLKKNFYSEVYNEQFLITRMPRDLVVKIKPINKIEAIHLVPDFEKRIGINNRFSNYRGKYVFKPDEFFLFRYRIPLPGDTGNLHIRFRTKSDNKLIDDFLEFLQESTTIRYCCAAGDLYKKIIESSLRDAYEESINENTQLIDDPQQMLIYMKKDRRMYWIRDTLNFIFDAMYLMQRRGYDISTVIDQINKVEIRPDKEDSSLIWNSAFNILKSRFT